MIIELECSHFSSTNNGVVKLNLPNQDDHIQKLISEKKDFYERDVLELIRAFLEEGGLFLDVGANIGNHSLFVASHTSAKIVAFEPGATAFSLFEENIKLNNYGERIKAKNIAIGDGAGEDFLVIDQQNLGASQLASISSHNLSDQETNKVQVLSLEEALEGIDLSTLKVIKIDVEGAELKVLQGAMSVIKKYRPNLFIENGHLGECYTLLTQIGYSIVDMAGATPVAVFVSNERVSQYHQRQTHHTILGVQRLASDIDRVRDRITKTQYSGVNSILDQTNRLNEGQHKHTERLANDIEALRNRLSRQHLDHTNRLNEEQQKHTNRLASDIEALRNRLSRTQTDFQKLLNQSDTLNVSHNEIHDQLSGGIQSLLDEIQEAENKITAKNESLTVDIQSGIQEVETIVSKITKDVGVTKKSVSRASQAVNKQITRLDTISTDFKTLQQEIAIAKKGINSNSRAIKQQTVSLKDISAELLALHRDKISDQHSIEEARHYAFLTYLKSMSEDRDREISVLAEIEEKELKKYVGFLNNVKLYSGASARLILRAIGVKK